MTFNPADLGYLAPYLILAVAGMLLVLAEAFYKGTDRSALVGLTVAGALSSAVASIVLYRQMGPDTRIALFGEMLIADRTGYVLSALFGVITAFTALMSPAHQREHDWQMGEYYGVMLLSASGMVMLAHAANLVTVFLGIETMSIGVYVMTAMRRRSRRGNEAAMKYFLIGAFATGFLMYGMALLYGASGTLSLARMQGALLNTANPGLVIAGTFMLVVAFGFKIAAVPFHMWAPDAYEGAPTPVTAFMASAVKAAAVAAMIRLGEPDGRDRRGHDHDRQHRRDQAGEHQADAGVLVSLPCRRDPRRFVCDGARLTDRSVRARLLPDRVLGLDDGRVRCRRLRRQQGSRAASGR
jgi:NADH-quinone oxidoreductase subunit N